MRYQQDTESNQHSDGASSEHPVENTLERFDNASTVAVQEHTTDSIVAQHNPTVTAGNTSTEAATPSTVRALIT